MIVVDILWSRFGVRELLLLWRVGWGTIGGEMGKNSLCWKKEIYNETRRLCSAFLSRDETRSKIMRFKQMQSLFDKFFVRLKGINHLPAT
jgi:hypothetical protein